VCWYNILLRIHRSIYSIISNLTISYFSIFLKFSFSSNCTNDNILFREPSA
jgi:hypothetical protein